MGGLKQHVELVDSSFSMCKMWPRNMNWYESKTREMQHAAYLDGAIHRATDKSVSIEV